MSNATYHIEFDILYIASKDVMEGCHEQSAESTLPQVFGWTNYQHLACMHAYGYHGNLSDEWTQIYVAMQVDCIFLWRYLDGFPQWVSDVSS